MGKYLDLAKQVPLRIPDPVQEPMPSIVPIPCESVVNSSKEEQRESLARLVDQGAGYVQVTTKHGDIFIALTDSVYHDLGQRLGVTVYHAAHLIELSDEEIRLMESLRTMNGPGGSVEIREGKIQ